MIPRATHARVNGAELYYETHGGGLPVLVMHGGLGWDHTYLRPWLDPLGSTAELIYYDHRGNGKSAAPDDWEAVDDAVYADDGDALREALGYDRIVVLGHSYGGALALEYALRHPERLHGLILVGTPPAYDYPETILGHAQARGAPDQVEVLQQVMAAPPERDEDYAEAIESLFPLYFHDYDKSPGIAIMREVQFRAAANTHCLTQLLPHYDVRPKASEMDVPALVVGGRSDFIVPPEEGPERLHELLPRSELAIFEQSGHMPFVEEQERFEEVVADWLQRL